MSPGQRHPDQASQSPFIPLKYTRGEAGREMGPMIKLGCKWDTLLFTKGLAFPAGVWSQKAEEGQEDPAEGRCLRPALCTGQ